MRLPRGLLRPHARALANSYRFKTNWGAKRRRPPAMRPSWPPGSLPPADGAAVGPTLSRSPPRAGRALKVCEVIPVWLPFLRLSEVPIGVRLLDDVPPRPAPNPVEERVAYQSLDPAASPGIVLAHDCQPRLDLLVLPVSL